MSDESAVRMEDLLAHRQWVRALARRLAADESRADDLEQATWLAAVESPPGDPRSLRGWLGTVLRNLHRNSLRGDVRRGRREESALRRELPHTADELVAEAEVQHLLVREVLDLDEPYRSTVLLRWFEDLTAQQVAERQDVPLETVRTRLKRAVERLRARMDARHGGDRRAWCLLLTGRGDGAGPGAATAAGTKAALTGAAGGLAMGAATKFAAAAVVVVAVGATAWWMSGDVAPPQAPPRAETAATGPAFPAAAKREKHSTPAAAVESKAFDLANVDRDLDLHGLVVRADGSAVVGAKVHAVDYPWRRTMTMNVAAWFDGTDGASTTSADGGAFALRLRRGEATNVRVSADGLATREVGPFQAGERVNIVMTPAVKLRVTLRDESGAPVAGATLWLVGGFDRVGEAWVNARAATDASGRCEFVGLPGGGQVAVAPLAGAGYFGQQRVTLPVSGEVSVDIVSPTGRTLRGRVFDAVTLAPVVDAKVGLGRALICATTTDGGGRFEMRGFTGKDESDLFVRAGGYAQTAARVGADDAPEIGLRRGVGRSGTVVDGEGRAVAGAYVAVEATRYDGVTRQVTCGYDVTGADGRFHVADLDRSVAHVITGFAAGHGRARKLVAPPRGDAEAIDVGDVRLAAPRMIEGRVLKADGAPSPGVEVHLVGPELPGVSTVREGSREQRRSDDLGRFRFGGLSPGDYSVEMQIAGGTPTTTKVKLPADRDVVDVVFQPKPTGDSVVVVVTDDAGAPVAEMGVGAEDDAGGIVQRRTDASGRAVLEPAKGRVAKIHVGGYSAGFLQVAPMPVEPGRREVAVTLERGVSMMCRVLDPDGAPLPRASITVEPAGRAVVYSTPSADGAWTDDEGRICVTLARQGAFSFVCHGVVYDKNRRKLDSLLEAREDHVVARSGELTLRCRRVETGRTATIRVLAVDGSPAAGVEVRLSAYAAVERKSKTDAEGRARFDGLPAREFLAGTTSRPGELPAAAEALVPAGQEVVLRFPVAATIAGSAAWTDGEAAAGAAVVVMSGQDRLYVTTADRDGRFAVQIPAEGAGPYRLSVSGRDGATWTTAEKEISAKDRDVRVEIKRQ